MVNEYNERITALLDERMEPTDIEAIRNSCGIGNWNTALKHCLELHIQGKIKGEKTSRGWLFWTNKIVQLNPWQEAVGTLERTEESETQAIAILSCKRQIAIALPKDLAETQKLKTLIGRRIGILRTDDLQRPLLITTRETHCSKSQVRTKSFVRIGDFVKHLSFLKFMVDSFKRCY